MDVRAPPTPPRRESLGEHLHHGVEVLARDVAVRVRPPHHLEQRILLPLLACHRRHDLLGQDVERVRRDDQPVELALVRGPNQRGTLDQLVARQREQPALGHGGEVVSRSTHALQQRRDRPGRADLAHQVHGADVDPQLERGGRDQRLELPFFEPGFRVEALFLGQAAVMRRHLVRAQPLGEMQRQPLRQPARVHEHQCGAMLEDQLHQALVNLLPHLGGHDRLER